MLSKNYKIFVLMMLKGTLLPKHLKYLLGQLSEAGKGSFLHLLM